MYIRQDTLEMGHETTTMVHFPKYIFMVITIVNTGSGGVHTATAEPIAPQGRQDTLQRVSNFLPQMISSFSSSGRDTSSLAALIPSNPPPSFTAEPDIPTGQRIGSTYNDAYEDQYLNITQLITKYGYPVEQHEVVTEDGYILTLFRIPGKRRAEPVLVQHGLFSSSDDWITLGPERALGYVLSREGYDVWLGNARGNKHSRRHVSLSPESDEFWAYSWDEIGRYDLPACIDYILHVTKFRQLKYVGHSQGTTSFYVMTSLRPEYNAKVKYLIALAAVTYMAEISSIAFNVLSPISYEENGLLRRVIGPEFLPDNPFTRLVKNIVCAPGLNPLQELLCMNLAFLAFGFDNSQIDFNRLPVILSHIPSGSATRQFQHYEQSVITGQFRRFDHGVRENLAEYGSPVPPSYPLSRITVPMTIFHGDRDGVADLADVQRFISDLTSAKVSFYRVKYDEFAHLDYLFGKDVDSLVYFKIMDDLRAN